MADNKYIRVFVTDARLSYPALDAPREDLNGEPRYQATFLLEPSNPCLAKIREAIRQVATAMFGQSAAIVMRSPDGIPLKRGDDKVPVPEGYAGMLYLKAKSKYAPELRDANPKIKITDQETILQKFVAGYRVNAYVDIAAYNFNGKKGVRASLVSVQFKAYADAFSGHATLSDDDYPDCSADADASSQFDPTGGASAMGGSAMDDYAPANAAPAAGASAMGGSAVPLSAAADQFDTGLVDDVPF